MNLILRPSDFAVTTQAAEGLPRRRWTVAEIEAMVEAGIILEDERFELIGGEAVPMATKGLLHETIKTKLNRIWSKRLPDAISMAQETTFRLNEDTFIEPDFVFFKTADGLARLSPATCLLAVEVADTSIEYDLGRKAELYARFAIVELWVIDAKRRDTHVFSTPGGGRYAQAGLVGPATAITPSFAPALGLKLEGLDDLVA